MALRFRRTIDVSPHMFSTREHADTDWLLYSGAWQVGRIHESLRPVEPRIVFVWSLTGPHTPEARVPMRGEAPTIAEAKQQMVDAMRAWAIWAGLRSADDSAPREPRWVEQDEGWLLISGEFGAGRVYRDLHWMLLGMSPTHTPGQRVGRAPSVKEAKAELLSAWQAWLEWAELQSTSSARR